MRREYSWNDMRRSRASSLSVVTAVFVSALLLSLLCSLAYNLWIDQIRQIQWEEGDWEGRITGKITDETLEIVRNYVNVRTADINEELSGEESQTLDITFYQPASVLEDMPEIARLIGLGEEAVTYHYRLLAMYIIRDPADTAPRLLFPFFLLVTGIACVSLIIVIHNAFAVTMNSRIRQLGIFSSVGATPRQIRACLMQEAAMLCALPAAAGYVAGLLLSMGALTVIDFYAGNLRADSTRPELVWQYHPAVFAAAAAAIVITIVISAWLPARKLGRMEPLEAIKYNGDLLLKKRKHPGLLSKLFGIEGELAANALRAQRRALRTSSLALTLSFLAFSLMQCLFTLSGISTQMTYFERYEDIWDVMVTVEHAPLEQFDGTQALRNLDGAASCVIYQKASARRLVTEEEISRECAQMEGLSEAPEEYVQETGEGWLVHAPVVILDDESFLEYCRQIGAPAVLDGAVILNQIRDVYKKNFREPDYMPYLNGEAETTILRPDGTEGTSCEIPVTAYTSEVPALREDYGTIDYYELVHFLPSSLWESVQEAVGGAQEELYVQILADDRTSAKALEALEEEARRAVGDSYETESENRIQEKEMDDRMREGMMVIMGSFCVLFALIGVGNVFSNALGFVRQRRREMARYLSVGMTPAGIKKMFCLEAAVIGGRPLAVTAPLTAAAVWLMLRASYLEPQVFLRNAPVVPILLFILGIFASVALAYYLGGRQLLRCELAQMLEDDTMR